MKSPQRQAIAAFAACLSGRCHLGVLIDQELDEPVDLKVNKKKDQLEISDSALNLLVVAEYKLHKWSLYDQRTSRYIELEESGKNFKGYDYESAQYFTLKISDENICIYDFETDDYHYFLFRK